MGCLPSKLSEPNVVAALQEQVRHLQQQLAAHGGGGGGPAYAPPVIHGGGQGGFSDVLFFPDPALPCHYGAKCRRHNCTFSHAQTSLTKLLSVLNGARSSLAVCVFTITCDEIADTLMAAHRRGVSVRVVTDNDQAKTTGSDIDKLRAAGVPVRMDSDAAHMHHKYCVVDNRLLLNGSFNWTRQAVLHNQENVCVTDNAALVRAFVAHFEALWRKYA